MTVEEIDIIVNASIEKALKEIEKLIPSIQKVVKQVTEKINSIDFSILKTKTQQAVNEVKKQLGIMKKSNENSKIELLVTNKDSQKQINQISKSIRSLKKQTEQRYRCKRF